MQRRSGDERADGTERGTDAGTQLGRPNPRHPEAKPKDLAPTRPTRNEKDAAAAGDPSLRSG
ncbi:MAG: hypothetical protein AVDCRST_MAG59-3678 [uncultured Thermomicrobiales bacterium]|uniref:Uncharacterized protein n=1 Tax=uncultured Thermomicrobiales bacterium TaxID=1645740 RepID=A0A6J4VB17_9BACT|nr:MAG: hypothetical protein AVDCRST_MAG59-3678 [uncultured Thermomicrobiales bacterium]